MGDIVLDMRWIFCMPSAGTAVSQQVLCWGFFWLALAQTLRMLCFPANGAREVRDHNTIWTDSCVCLHCSWCWSMPRAAEWREKKHPCPCGLWILPYALSGFSSLPRQLTALWLLSVFGLKHKYPSWFPETGPGRTKICPVPPCTLFKTAVLNKFCGGVQSWLERNESLASTSGGFGSGLTCLFLLLVQSLGFLPGIHWELFDFTVTRMGSKMSIHKGNEQSFQKF